MTTSSLIINLINKGLTFSQEKSKFLRANSWLLQNINNFIFATIIIVILLSTFASSDVIGYVALTTIFLTVIKLFITENEKIEPNLFELFLLFYLLFVVVSLFGSSLFTLSVKGFLKTATYLGFYFSATQYFRKNISKIPVAIFLIAISACSQTIIGLFQNFAQVSEISTWQDVSNLNPEEVMTRVYGSLKPLNPNLLGGYLVTCLPALFGSVILFLADRKYLFSIFALIASLLTTYVLILTGCRGAYIGLFAILFITMIFTAKFVWCDIKERKEFFQNLYLSAVASIVACVTTVILFIPAIRLRISSIFAMRSDSSTSFRLNVYQSVIQMIKDNWILGIGVGNQNFREIYGLYMKTGFDALSAYSVFLETFVESGIFALIAFLGFLISFLYMAIKFIYNNKNKKYLIYVMISFICVSAVMTHGLVDTIYFRPQLQFVFWTMVSIASAVFYVSEKTD